MSQRKEKYARSMERRMDRAEARIERNTADILRCSVLTAELDDELAVYRAAMRERRLRERARAERAQEAKPRPRREEWMLAAACLLAAVTMIAAAVTVARGEGRTETPGPAGAAVETADRWTPVLELEPLEDFVRGGLAGMNWTGKQGAALRYIAITSDMDGDTGEAVRIHHHLIVPAEAKEAFVEKWKDLGGVDWSSMSQQEDYTPIAEYFMRQVRRVPDAKKYVSSRNLVRPQAKDRVVLTDAELRVPQGGKLLHRNEYKPGRPQYIRYVLPKARGTAFGTPSGNMPGVPESRRRPPPGDDKSE